MSSYLRQSRLGLLAAILVLTSTLSADDDGGDYKIQLSDWSYSRARKTVTAINHVVGVFNVKNLTKDDIKDVSVTLCYTTSTGEKAVEPVTKKVGDMKAGESRKVELMEDMVPAFEAYEVTVTYAGNGKEAWYSSSDMGQPQQKSSALDKGVANLIILGREGGVDRAGQFNGSVRVKNQGTVEAKNVKCVINFTDDKKKNLGDFTCVLGTGKLAGGAEQNIPVHIPNCPRTYSGYLLKVVCDDTPAEAADFTGVADVEFARFAFKREPKSPDLKVTARVRNGLSDAACNIVLKLSFTNGKKPVKTFAFTYSDTLLPGEDEPVAFTIPAMPVYDGFEQALTYEKHGGAAPDAAKNTAVDKEAAPTQTSSDVPRFKQLPDVEVIFTGASTDPDKTVVLVGAMRNGKDVPVKNVVITAAFSMPTGGSVHGDKTLSDVIQPGEQRNFILKAPNAAGFKDYTFRFTSEPVK